MHQKMTFFAFGLWLATIAPLSMAQVSIDEIGILKNTKEAQTGVLKEQEILEIKTRYNNQDFNEKIKAAFYQTMHSFLNHDLSECESHVILHFEENLKERNIKTGEVYNQTYLKILRVNHYIDDIVYKIVIALNQDYYTFKVIDQKFPNVSTSIDIHDNPKYVDQFSAFKTWPDEVNTCQYTEFANLLNDIELNTKKVTRKKKLHELRRLSKNAYSQGIISNNTYLKLKYLSKKSKAVNSRFWLSDYFYELKAVKDSMVPRNLKNEIVDITLESKFSSVQLKRLKNISRREQLYIKYTPQQIGELASILIKASRRMGVDPDVKAFIPTINQTFTFTNQDGEVDNYVETYTMDSQQQYNYARKRMRKDILDLQATENFKKTTIYYQDIVLAAFEVGYITFEDLEIVITYDDLWNPTRTKFQRMVNFIFRVANIGTFFVPPPFNIVGAIALTVVEGVVDSKNANGANNDNAATIID